MTHWDALATLAGGVGLFLLGMTMMSDGLRMAAGPSLERILRAATHTPWHGLGSGVLVTALVQSSSAVTVATIGFVKAGLLPWLLAATRAAGAWLNLPRNWRCFVATHSDAGVPRFLNHTLTKVPVLATEALGRELHRLGHLAEGLLRQNAPVDPSGALELVQLDLANDSLTAAHSELKAHGLAKAAAGRLSLGELDARLHRAAALRDAA